MEESTRLLNNRFNIDFYSFDGNDQHKLIQLDLGNWSYTPSKTYEKKSTVPVAKNHTTENISGLRSKS
ncbi:MAG: hypothetical protein HQM16_05275 [Deltaproteobacteria bacterium]|nr:hypothetical protein [Deltaproteobacteria bacterium]